MRSTLARAAARSGGALLEVVLPFGPALADAGAVAAAYEEALKIAGGGGKIKLAVIDHCISFPPVIMPVAQLCSLFRSGRARAREGGCGGATGRTRSAAAQRRPAALGRAPVSHEADVTPLACSCPTPPPLGCREAGVPVLVDGAHGLGALPGLDVPALGADYYVSNAHKWLVGGQGGVAGRACWQVCRRGVCMRGCRAAALPGHTDG